MIKRVPQDNKVPGTFTGTREAAAPSPVPAGSAARFLGESWVNGSLPCQTRFELYQEGPECLKSQGRNKEEMTNTHRWCTPTETVDTAWEELGSDRP